MLKRCLMLGGLALLALPAWADELIPFKGPMRQMYYKPATGEVREITGGGAPRIGSTIVWDSTLETGVFSDLPSTKLVLDWGDLDPARLGDNGAGGTNMINGFKYAFATNGTNPPTVNIAFWGNENGRNSTGRVPLANGTFTVPGTGSPTQGTLAAWVITIDLEGGFEFPITGPDLDADGKRDFGYSYWMQSRANATMAGPVVAGGQPVALPDQPGAPGAEDLFDRFSNASGAFDPNSPALGAGTVFDGSLFLPGHNPFAQFYFQIRSNAVLLPVGGCCLPNNSCSRMTHDACTAAQGSYLGDSQPCAHAGDQLAQASASPNAPIADGLAGGGDGPPTVSTVTIAGAAFTAGIFEVDVRIPDHTYISDLRIELSHNGGPPAVLWDNECGANDGLTVTFKDDAPVAACASPTTGNVRSLGNLAAAFGGANPNGTWTLTVVDTFAGDTGTLASWGIRARDALANCANACSCAGDFNGDHAVGLSDLTLFLASFGGAPSNPCMDTNNDHVIGLADLTAFLSRFGSTCP